MKNKEKLIGPDWYKIPRQLADDDNLTALDGKIYAIVYWFSRLKLGECIASNTSIAEIARTTTSTISNSLWRLEKHGYISREFSDQGRNRRTKIFPLLTDEKNRVRVHQPVNTNIDSGTLTSEHEQKSGTLSSEQGGTLASGLGTLTSEHDVHHKKEPKYNEKPLKISSSGKADQKSGTLADEEREIYNKKIEEDLFLVPKNGTINSDSENFLAINKNGKKDTSNPDITPAEINEAIALFLPILPGDFVGKSSAFAKPPTRAAVKALLTRMTNQEIKSMIEKYAMGKTDRFRPEVGTIYEFCTIKLAKIEAYISKSASMGNVWAQKPISTPEQSAVRDDQYNKKLERSREKVRKAKEEWEKNHSSVK